MASPSASAPLSALAAITLALLASVLGARLKSHRVLLPVPKESEPVMARAAREVREGRPLDINAATGEELQLLPRVGPALSERIIAGRPYRSVEELVRVSGIGPRTLERLRSLVHVNDGGVAE